MGAPATSTSSHPRHRNDNLPTTESAEEELKKMKDDKKERITGMGTLDTYLSLIQQYLAVFMVKNATFFAERCVAEYPDSQEAVYLLALCYYRAGSPRSARQALEKQRTVLVTTGVRDIGISSSNNSNAGSNSRSVQFLSAQCSFDLKDYTRAEDALLRECRASYKQNRSYVSDGGAMGGIVTNANSLDEWILNTTVSSRKVFVPLLLLFLLDLLFATSRSNATRCISFLHRKTSFEYHVICCCP